MKKNMMMRVAFVLLIAVLLTTSVIGGTFARYVTFGHGGNDSAKIAKFGVSVQIEDDFDMFNTEYETDSTAYSGELSVKSSSDSNLIAPGTKGGSMKLITIVGQPEVATKMTCNVTGETIKLPAGRYTLPAGYYKPEETTIETTETYEPIKSYFGSEPIDNNTKYELTMEQLTAKIKETYNQTYSPNFDYSSVSTCYIGWRWYYQTTSFSEHGFMDTYLGYEAANGNAQEVSLSFNITIEQVD